MTPAAPILFDAARRTIRQKRATAAGGGVLWREAGEGLYARLLPVTRSFATALAVDGRAPTFLPREDWLCAGFDADERLSFAGKADLAVSLLSLQSLNDLPGALRQIRQRLNPGGLFLAALFGGDSLIELRDSLAVGEALVRGTAVRRVAPFADVRDLGALLQRAGFMMAVADGERTLVRYADIGGLFADLRAMGETGIMAGPRQPLTRRVLAAAMAHYADAHADADGKLRATFDIVYLTGWAAEAATIRRKLRGAAR